MRHACFIRQIHILFTLNIIIVSAIRSQEINVLCPMEPVVLFRKTKKTLSRLLIVNILHYNKTLNIHIQILLLY